MKKYPFNTAYTQAKDLYGVELTEDEFENLGMIAWGRIGNKYYRLYKYQIEPTQDELGAYYFELPCNVDIIESITAGYEDYQTTSATASYTPEKSWGEDYTESAKTNTNFLYSSGKFIKYDLVENRVYLSGKYSKVTLLYKGIIVDNDGLPSLNEKEIDAVAVFCAYSKMYKKGLTTGNGNLMNMTQMLKADWKSLCTQARVPEYLNQNEMDEILNASVSWDRKRFGISYKTFS